MDLEQAPLLVVREPAGKNVVFSIRSIAYFRLHLDSSFFIQIDLHEQLRLATISLAMDGYGNADRAICFQ